MVKKSLEKLIKGEKMMLVWKEEKEKIQLPSNDIKKVGKWPDK